jgi:glycosyltransferase involved in cell wall biosynthesis
MQPGSSCLAVIPAYNEAATIRNVIRGIREHASGFDVLVIDDGSTDRTPDLAEDEGARVIRLPFNLGIGGAMQTGFRFALDNDYDYMVQVDGDGQHDPADIWKLQDAMNDGTGRGRPLPATVDIACGSRFLTDDHEYPAPISRRTGIHIFAFLVSRIVGERVSDPTSGFRLYNRRGIALFARDYPHDYPEVEAILMLHWHRLRMTEVPVRMFERGGGVSSIGGSGKPAIYMLKVLLAVFVGLCRRRPVVEPGDEAPVMATQGI